MFRTASRIRAAWNCRMNSQAIAAIQAVLSA